jgi:hypothetical protein
MISRVRIPTLFTACLLCASTIQAQDSGVRQDARAIEVLKSMSAYTASLDRVFIGGITFTDARLGGGLIVSNSNEVTLSIDRPGSLHIGSFDGVQSKELYFHEGTLTVFNSERNFYAQASIPKDVEAAMEFALEELEVEAPLMDFIRRDASTHLIGSQDAVLYLTDKARVAGVDCHHIAIRGEETDVQLWVEEGDQPVPRRIMITSKWEGGAPRFVAHLVWNSKPVFKQDIFEFKAPEGSMNIGFAQSHRDEGE